METNDILKNEENVSSPLKNGISIYEHEDIVEENENSENNGGVEEIIFDSSDFAPEEDLVIF